MHRDMAAAAATVGGGVSTQSSLFDTNTDLSKNVLQTTVNGLVTGQHHKKQGSGDTPSNKNVSGNAGKSDDEDDVPLLLRKRKPGTATPSQTNGHSKEEKSPPLKRPKLEKTPAPTSVNKPPVSGSKVKAKPANPIKSEDEDDTPLSMRKSKTPSSTPNSVPKKTEDKTSLNHKAKKRKVKEESDDDDYKPNTSKSEKAAPKKSSTSKNVKNVTKNSATPTKSSASPTKSSASPGSSPSKKKKEEQEQEVWRWWEEVAHGEGIKWKFLEHKGPIFAPAYEPVPPNVKFYYDGKEMKLSTDTEEVASFYSRMLDHEYTTMDAFNKNFFKDWRKVMTTKEREVITDLKKCDFKELNEYFKQQAEERKAMSKEEKQKLKQEKDAIQLEYGVAVVDGHKEKIGNFRIEPPGLFRGRGTHPKMGMLKRRVLPEDVIINCSKGSKVPVPPPGHKWKEVRHDNTVTWLACWTENIMGSIKYVMLNPSSKIKGEKDWMKYETARKLNKCVDKIRREYKEDWKSKEMKTRQRAVALYFIDKLALRAGNEKEEGETADTVGCCSLRCEHLKLYDELDGQECVVEFDFLGKDSIRYYNRVPVEKRVFKNLNLFMENKDPGDDVFDRLNTSIMNKYLQNLMDGLTAKVFRTYNASHTLQEQLELLTKPEMTVAEKLLAYNRANRQVAILCNHQRAVPKSHGKQMENLQQKITEKQDAFKAAKKELKQAKADHKANKNDRTKKALDQKQRQYDRVNEQLQKLQLRATDKEENKEIALSTSKLNYLDPRISVAWCKKYGIPVEKIYNKTQREKFRWAIDMAGPDFVF